MITFLRKVRQQLLSDGKFSKYLLYAVGEIVLVVIGILIALQIDQWNDDKQDRKLEKQYLTRLVGELHEDASNYEMMQGVFEEIGEAVLSVQGFWMDDSRVIQDSLQFWTDFRNSSGFGPWYKEPIIWNQLVQSGDLKVIRDQELIEALFTYYVDVKQVADNYNEYPTETTNRTREAIASSFAETDYMLKDMRQRGRFPEKEWFVKIRREKESFQPIFVRQGVIAQIHTNSMERLSGSTKKIIRKLEQYLEGHD